MSKGVNGTSDPEGSNLCWLSRELIKATSIVYFPAFRSASTRFTVSVAFPVDTSTVTPNFFWKTSTTGRYWRDGAPPEAIATVPSRFAAAMSLDHSSSKWVFACGADFSWGAAARAVAFDAVASPKAAVKKNRDTPRAVRTYGDTPLHFRIAQFHREPPLRVSPINHSPFSFLRGFNLRY